MKLLVIFLLPLLLLGNPNQLNDKEYELDLLKASNYLTFESYDLATNHLNQALLKAPENPRNHLYLAIFSSGIKRYETSLKFLKKIRNFNSELLNFYTYYNYYFLKTKLTPKGKKNFLNAKNKLITQYQKLPKDKLLFLAVTTFEAKDYKNSMLFFQEAIKKDKNLLELQYEINFIRDIVTSIYLHLSPPYDFYYYNSLGSLQIRLKDYKAAIKNLKKALTIDQNNVLAKKLLADAYFALEDYSNALKYLKDIQTFFNDKEEVYLMLNQIYRHKKEYKKASKICQDGLGYLFYSKDLRFCLANSLYFEKNYAKALYHLDYLINQYPKSSDINFLLAQVLEDLIKALSLESEPYKRIAMGENYIKKFDNFVEYYLKAIELNPINHKVVKKIFGSILEGFKKESELYDDQEALEKLTQKGNQAFLQYSEPFMEKENLETANRNFYKNFVRYLKTPSDALFKEMKYLFIGATMVKYLEYLKTPKNEKSYKHFMSPYSKGYLKLLKQKHRMNQYLHTFTFDNVDKNIEQLKIVPFIIPSYFD